MINFEIAYENNGKTVSHRLFTTIDDNEVVELVERKFEYLRSAGIVNNEFSDDSWWCNNGSQPYGLNFNRLNMDLYDKYMSHRMDYDAFVKYLKLYIIYIFDKTAMDSIQNALNGLTQCFEDSHYFDRVIAFKGSQGQSQKLHLIKFLKCLPIDNDEYISELERHTLVIDGGRYDAKELSDFMTYFVLDEEIRQFWKTDIPEKDRIYYYPFYIYWILTTVLSIRVTEYCLTPYDCLEYNAQTGRYSFTYRVTDLKGKKERKYVSHSMDDYQIHKAIITNEIADEIIKYRNLRAKYGGMVFLFSTEAYAENSPIAINKIRDVFNRDHLNQLKNSFVERYLIKQRGYRLLDRSIDEDMPMEDFTAEFNNRISYFQNKDTRHISAMNMILNGSSIQALTVMTNHMTAEMALHYANNTEKFQQSRLYYFYMRHRFGGENEISYSLTANSDDLENAYIRARNLYNCHNVMGIDMGDVICYSKNRAEGKLTDCRPNIKMNTANPCINCVWRKLKKEAQIQLRTECNKKISRELEMIAKMLPINEEKSMEDLGKAVDQLQESGKTITIALLEEQINGKTA